jgi:hypothetical protein
MTEPIYEQIEWCPRCQEHKRSNGFPQEWVPEVLKLLSAKGKTLADCTRIVANISIGSISFFLKPEKDINSGGIFNVHFMPNYPADDV